MCNNSEEIKLLDNLPVQAGVILSHCYDTMAGSPRFKNKAKAHSTHIEQDGDKIVYVGLIPAYNPVVPTMHIIDALVEQGLMEEFSAGKFRPTKRGFHIGKLASERS